MDDRAREIADEVIATPRYDFDRDELAAAISALCDEREREALERAAKVAEDHHNSHPDAICGITIATIIRSLIKTAPEGETK